MCHKGRRMPLASPTCNARKRNMMGVGSRKASRTLADHVSHSDGASLGNGGISVDEILCRQTAQAT